MAEVFKKPGSPYYYYDYTVSGKRYRGSTKRTKKKEAKAFADQQEQQLLDSIQFGSGKPTLTMSTAMDFYLKKHRNNPASMAQQRADKLLNRRAAEGIEGFDPDLPFHELTTTMLKAYVQKREDNGAAAQTINHELNALSCVYNMVKEDYVVREGLTFPRLTTTDIPRPLMDDEVDALLTALDPYAPMVGRNGKTYVPEQSIGRAPTIMMQRQQNYDLVIAMLNTGCRLNEIGGVTWDHVADDFSSFTFFRQKTKDKTSGRYYRAEMKCSDALREVFQRRHAERGNSPFVFPAWENIEGIGWITSKEKGQHSTQAIRRAMSKIGINTDTNIAIYGRRDVRSLRDTFATRLVRRKVRLEVVQKLLGHASIKQTEKYASYCMDDVNDEAVSVLNSL